MTNRLVKIQLFVFFNFIILPFSQGQIREFSRGHTMDDLYVWSYTLKTTNDSSYLLYITDYGKNLTLKDMRFFSCWNLTADPVPGKIIGQLDQSTRVSTDYGETFNTDYPFVDWYCSIMQIYGGSIPGEFLYMAYDIRIWPTQLANLYKTTDYGITFNRLAEYVPPILNGEIGSISGEVYQMPIIDGHAYLCHSLDFGISFDSIPIDSTIINENDGQNFFKLSHCSQQGELFLVTKGNNSEYKLYHSTDYGNSWELKNMLTFDSDSQRATAGREDCSFYFASIKETAGSDYFTLQILYSGDCGQTFTTYEYPLNIELGVQETKSKCSEDLSFSPNPANDHTIVSWESDRPTNAYLYLYNSVGAIVHNDCINTNQAGIINHKMDLSNLSEGIYLLKLQSDNSTRASGKLIISR